LHPHQHNRLCALRSKYQTMLQLRAAGRAPSAPRAQLSALANECPGALRELDQLPIHFVEERLAAIEQALAQTAPVERWMELQSGYHGFMRATLRIRRLSRGRPLAVLDAQRELAELPYEPAEDEPPAQRFSAMDLATIRRPPAGRLNPWVLEQVAHDHGVTPELVRKALFLR
jgi:hypothetical protein